jgi:hypothetical protein
MDFATYFQAAKEYAKAENNGWKIIFFEIFFL